MLKIELEKDGSAYGCRALQRTQELGNIRLRLEGELVYFESAVLENPEDYGLLDGLMRAGLDAARSDGAISYLIPPEAPAELLRGFDTYDYAIGVPEELERFFSRHSCKGMSF